MDKCALCGQIKELKLSHIIPKFVFDYIVDCHISSG